MADMWRSQGYCDLIWNAVRKCTKYRCFLHIWDSHHGSSHYEKNYPKGTLLKTRIFSTFPQLPVTKSYCHLYTIKFRLLENFVETMNQEGEVLKYLKRKFPQLSDDKIKEGLFVGMDICEMFKNEIFNRFIETNKKAA